MNEATGGNTDNAAAVEQLAAVRNNPPQGDTSADARATDNTNAAPSITTPAAPAANAATATPEAPLVGELNRVTFFARAKEGRRVERVELPWMGRDAHTFVKSLDSNGRDEFEDRVYSVKDGKLVSNVIGVRALLIRLCACDADGAEIFTDGDLEQLGKLDARTADAIYAPAARLSGITQADVDAMVKNSESGRSAAQ